MSTKALILPVHLQREQAVKKATEVKAQESKLGRLINAINPGDTQESLEDIFLVEAIRFYAEMILRANATCPESKPDEAVDPAMWWKIASNTQTAFEKIFTEGDSTGGHS